ncbi:hypothetical protein [Paenibacillus timonensis]|uniref:hypothetical protein n=1 Tax=Paenibacillus timonensis TaxID=225915 RepID=UPI0036D3371E
MRIPKTIIEVFEMSLTSTQAKVPQLESPAKASFLGYWGSELENKFDKTEKAASSSPEDGLLLLF